MINEIAVKEPSELIRLAIEKGSDLDKLEKLLNIQREYNKAIACQEYHKAMSAFKAEPITIDKDKSVNFGTGKAAYKHASLFNITKKVGPLLSKHGLSVSWTTEQNGTISVSCKVTHELGHSEKTTLSANADKTGNKNDIQAVGSTVTYLQRYTLLSLLGLATADQDDDGAASSKPIEYITEKQLSQLRDMMADKDIKEDRFCDYLKVESLEYLLLSDFQKAAAAVKAKVKK